jgi:hypothetical protein
VAEFAAPFTDNISVFPLAIAVEAVDNEGLFISTPHLYSGVVLPPIIRITQRLEDLLALGNLFAQTPIVQGASGFGKALVR